MRRSTLSATVDHELVPELDAAARRLRRTRSQLIGLALHEWVQAERQRSGEPVALAGTEVRGR